MTGDEQVGAGGEHRRDGERHHGHEEDIGRARKGLPLRHQNLVIEPDRVPDRVAGRSPASNHQGNCLPGARSRAARKHANAANTENTTNPAPVTAPYHRAGEVEQVAEVAVDAAKAAAELKSERSRDHLRDVERCDRLRLSAPTFPVPTPTDTPVRVSVEWIN